MDERERWWNRYKTQVASVRKFISDARTEDQIEALEAFQDVLDEIRQELLEETQKHSIANRACDRPKCVHEMYPLLRPVASVLAGWLSRMGRELEWKAAGIRAKL
jgi:hypothetical protein